MAGVLEFVRRECSGLEGGIPVLIAHNGKTFDYKFLDQQCKQWNFQLPREWQWMDTLLLAKDCVKDTPTEKALRSQVGTLKASNRQVMFLYSCNFTVGKRDSCYLCIDTVSGGQGQRPVQNQRTCCVSQAACFMSQAFRYSW